MLTVTANLGRKGRSPLQPQVLGLDGEDRLSAGFLWHLDHASSQAVPAAEVLGQRTLITIRRSDGGEPRLISAVVTGWEDLGTIDLAGHGTLNAYRARLEPALARLDQDQANGVHAGRTAIQVATDLLSGRDHAGATADPDLAVDHYDGFLTDPRPTRQQVLRWRESTAAVVRRLLEDEGVATYFTHQSGSDSLGTHTLVLSERNQNNGEASDGADKDDQAKERRRNAANPVVTDVVRQRNAANAVHRRLWRWQTVDRDGPAKVAVADHDYRDWSNNRKVDAQGSRALDLSTLGSPSVPAGLARCEYPAGLAGLADGSAFDPAPGHQDATIGSHLAERRAGELLCRRRRLRGEGDHIGLQAGTLMSFSDRPDERFLVIGARLSLRPVLAASLIGGMAELPLRDALLNMAMAAAETRWERPGFDVLSDPPQALGATLSWQGLGMEARCAVEALPLAIPFVPERRQAPPALAGIHLATVVADSGSTAAIHTDSLARVQVAFPWDPGHPTGWIRVVQPQAGDGGGMLIIPRVGDEVAVAFAWGGSDQPLVLGGLFNSSHKPPHDPSVTANQARTVLRSRGLGTPSEERHDPLPGETRISKVEKEVETVVNGTTTTSKLEEFAVTSADKKSELTEWGCNELALDDTAGAQRADLFAARNLNLVAGADGVLRAGKSLVIDAGESLTIRVGNTMLKMEHGELTMGVYCAACPDASSSLSFSTLDFKASAASVAITGLLSASMSSSGSSVQTELSGVMISGISAEMSTSALGVLNLIQPIANLATSAGAKGQINKGQGVESEYEESLPWPEAVALADECLMSGAEVFQTIGLFAHDPTALIGAGTVECLGGKVELFTTLSLWVTIPTIGQSICNAVGSTLADYPDTVGCKESSAVFNTIAAGFSATSAIAWTFLPSPSCIEINSLGTMHSTCVTMKEKFVEKNETGMNHSLDAVQNALMTVGVELNTVNEKVNAVDTQVTAVSNKVDTVEGEVTTVKQNLTTTQNAVTALENSESSLTVNLSVTSYQLTAVLVQL